MWVPREPRAGKSLQDFLFQVDIQVREGHESHHQICQLLETYLIRMAWELVPAFQVLGSCGS